MNIVAKIKTWNKPAGRTTWRQILNVAMFYLWPLIDVLTFWRQKINTLTAIGFVAIIRV